jgi:hypothetical protein
MKLISHMFDGKFSCTLTKSEAIITNLLKPLANDELSKDLCEATFVTVLTAYQ